MSGWDTSSTPSWDRPDGPEDSTQAFSAPDPDPGTGASDTWSAPPPEFFPDYGQQQEPPRPGFGQQSDLPRRGRHHASVPDAAYGQDPSSGQEAPYPQDAASGTDASSGADAGYGQDATPRQDSAATSWDRLGGRASGGRPPWEDGPGQDLGQVPARPRFVGPEPSRGDSGRSGFDAPEVGTRGDGRPGRTPDRTEVSRDPGRRDPATGRPGWGQQPPSGEGHPDREAAARRDPALQDFFAPQQPRHAAPPSGNGRRVPGATLAGSGLPGSGQPRGQGLPPANGGGPRTDGFGRGPRTDGFRGGPRTDGFGGGPRTDGFRGGPRTDGFGGGPRTDGFGGGPRTDGSGRGQDAPAVPPRRAGTRPPRTPEHAPDRAPVLGGRGRLIAIAVVVVVAIIVGVVLLTHKSSPSTTGATSTPTVTHSAKPKPSATKPAAPPAATGPLYTLSTPATAGPYPMGQDPQFLAAAKTTSGTIVLAVSSGGGGTVQGGPVSASYQLPTGGQVMEFVGYQGTFNPAKVATILKSLGKDPNSYSAGPHGGVLGCANTPTSPSGAVCVWSTTSTLGVVEFFNAAGPETLTTAQAKGAADVVQLRSGVEKAKS